ncbi:MAG: multiheme c-type cytochrome [Myxococcota bacterium]|nr:multiheme c-type cytochrome [Myxococcota bacterium]
MRLRGQRAFLIVVLFATVSACSSNKLPTEELMKPEACQSCHPKHYQQWAGSMHAYAAFDPVFIAMNERGQRETNGELGDFCVKCHAPMALLTGATTDGLNLDEVPNHLKGVTCYFCHQVDEIVGDHNAKLNLADDDVMRGGIADPVENSAHESKYSPLHDRNSLESAALCGSCHDIVTQNGVHLERTFEEWKGTLFAHDTPAEKLTCSGCHMRGSNGLAANYDGVMQRRIHDHSMPGVDVAVTDFFELEAQRNAIQYELDNTLLAQLCVLTTTTGANIDYTLENVAAGHGWPSGAAHDRRAWVELVAYQGDVVVFESGVIQPDQALKDLEDDQLWRLGDFAYDKDDNTAHFFWDVARVESIQLPGQAARNPTEPDWVNTHITHRYKVDKRPDRVVAKVHYRAMGRDVIQDLIDSGDLAPEIIDRIPQFTLKSTVLEWSGDSLFPCVPVQ